MSDFFIALLETLDGGVQATHVLVDEEVLFFLFEEGLGDFFKVLDAAFFLDFLEILVNQVHVFLVLINNLDFFLILGNQVSESQL